MVPLRRSSPARASRCFGRAAWIFPFYSRDSTSSAPPRDILASDSLGPAAMMLLRRVVEKTLGSTASLRRLSTAPRPTPDSRVASIVATRLPRPAVAMLKPLSSFESRYHSRAQCGGSAFSGGAHAAIASAVAAVSAGVALLSWSADPCHLQAEEAAGAATTELSNKYPEHQEEYFTFGQRRTTPNHQKDRSRQSSKTNVQVHGTCITRTTLLHGRRALRCGNG